MSHIHVRKSLYHILLSHTVTLFHTPYLPSYFLMYSPYPLSFQSPHILTFPHFHLSQEDDDETDGDPDSAEVSNTVSVAVLCWFSFNTLYAKRQYIGARDVYG